MFADAIEYSKSVEAESRVSPWRKVDVPKIWSAEWLVQVQPYRHQHETSKFLLCQPGMGREGVTAAMAGGDGRPRTHGPYGRI